VLARPPKLSLAFLGTHVYGDGTKVLASDAIGDTTRAYQRNAAAMHRLPRYRDRVYGHARHDTQGRLWLQYWLFYYYNDFQLLGPFSAGKHEGDWELVQLRLDAAEQPVQAVFSQHRQAEAKPWAALRKSGPAPLVYVARGSHANYFGAGSHWTGPSRDRADGKGPQITPALEVVEDTTPWMLWPGLWGDTKATSSPIDSNSPNSPGRRAHWLNPAALLAVAERRAVPPAARDVPGRPAVPRPPSVTARRVGDRIVLAYDAPPEAVALLVATRPRGQAVPATTRTFPLDTRSGEVELTADGDVELWASVARADGAVSESVTPA
jgi:hypothetical protein